MWTYFDALLASDTSICIFYTVCLYHQKLTLPITCLGQLLIHSQQATQRCRFKEINKDYPARIGQMNGCAGRVSGLGHIKTVPAKLPGQRANSPLERRGKILLPGNGYSGDTGKRTVQKEVRYGGDYHKGFGRVQGTGRMDKKSGESGGRGYGTDTPDGCGRALHDGG